MQLEFSAIRHALVIVSTLLFFCAVSKRGHNLPWKMLKKNWTSGLCKINKHCRKTRTCRNFLIKPSLLLIFDPEAFLICVFERYVEAVFLNIVSFTCYNKQLSQTYNF